MSKPRNLRSQILNLHEQGYTQKEIANILKCAKSAVSYHIYPNERLNCIRRTKNNPIYRKITSYLSSYKREYKIYKRQINLAIQKKIYFFMYLKKKYKGKQMSKLPITKNDVINKFGENPVCYLSGKKLNWEDASTYSFDHKLPISRGGESTIDNMGICDYKVNQCKNNLTPEEFIQMCKDVLLHQGYAITKSN